MDSDSNTEFFLLGITNHAFSEVLAVQKTVDSSAEQTVKTTQVGGQAEIANRINRCVDLLRVRYVQFAS